MYTFKEVIDLFFRIVEWIPDLNWYLVVFVLPVLKGWFTSHQDKKKFQEIFGFSWPKNDEERKFTVHQAKQILLMFEQQSNEARKAINDVGSSFAKSGMKNMLASFRKDMKKRIDKFEKAKELLSKAGYRDLISGLPEIKDDE